MREQVIELLAALGVMVEPFDPLLDVLLDNVQYKVLNETGTRLPMEEGLQSVAVYMVAGEYLRMKKAAGQLTGFDLEAAVKQIQQGDTNVQFAIGEGSSTPEQRLDAIIDYLVHGRERELYRYRRVIW